MNTEPPEGDDLHRMLVSMKQNVLERATPHPKRRRVRPGIVIGVVGLLAIGTATGAVALSLSQQEQPTAAPTQTQQPEPAPSATTPTSAPITATPRPSLTPSAAPTRATGSHVRLPGDCYLLVPDADYSRFFGAASHTSTVVSPGLTRDPDGNDRIQGLRDPDEGLSCTWQNEGVVANLTLSVGPTAVFGTGTPEETVRVLGGTCEDKLGGRVCQVESSYPGDPVVTTLIRDGVIVTINQTDFPTDGLMPAIVGEIWGD
jgi:hypothetical protein